jgi:hypothetical protein
MHEVAIHQQRHGYRNGHQLLSSTLKLDRRDQDTVDRLSDLSGQIRPGEVLPSYLTIYPLPSGNYHVLARTWPDLDAPRAGCVITRTLLVPRDYWDVSADLRELLDIIADPGAEKLQSVSARGGRAFFPPASDPRATELAEALFLEARKPIVFFDAIDPELLASRLLTAFWPAFRRDFALCTYALGPRKIGGRDFDLLFSPKHVRSKFSDWHGRKIEAGPPMRVRHRWTTAVADAIFASPEPTLAAGDALGLLGDRGPGDEAAFRKSLLWNELVQKAPTSGSAILGMLDIVNSQPELRQNTARLLPVFQHSISSALALMSPKESWSFLQILCAKVQGKDLMPISDAALNKVSALASQDPNSAIEFTERFEDGPDPYTERILSQLADGIASGDLSKVDLGSIPRSVGTFFIAKSSAFTAALAKQVRLNSSAARDILPFLQSSNSSWHDEATTRLFEEVDSPNFAPLLPALLSAEFQDPAERLHQIVRRSGLRFPEFDDAILTAIRDDKTLMSVRDIAAKETSEICGDRFLMQTLRLVPDDIRWIHDGPLQDTRSAKLLSSLLSTQDDRSLVACQRDPNIRREILETLAREPSTSANEIARILTLGAASVDDLLRFGTISLNALSDKPARRQLLGTIVEQGLANASPDDQRVTPLVAHYFDEIGAFHIIRWSVGERFTIARVTANLAILRDLPSRHQLALAEQVDELSYRLSRLGYRSLNEDLCSSWATLLWWSRKLAPRPHLKGATTSLSAVIDATKWPVAEIIAAAFPAVYQELSARRQDERDGIVDMILALPRMFVHDWDRAKPARHGLVDAFMQSNWPPSYLLLTAARAGILDRVLLRLSRQKGGKKYLSRAIADLDRLSIEERSALRSGLETYKTEDMKDEWD